MNDRNASDFDDPQLRPRYTGLPTFMRAPFREDLTDTDIALVGVPFDGGVTNRTGARHGPREIRNQSSLMRKINQSSRIAPFELARVADIGDAWIRSPFALERSLDEIAEFFDRAGNTALVGATMMFEILCVVADAFSHRFDAARIT